MRQYMKLLRQMRGKKGSRKYAKLKKRATAMRRRMIAANTYHSVDGLPKKKYGNLKSRMPEQYAKELGRVLRTSTGRKGLKKFRQFWSLPFPPELEADESLKKNLVLVGAGWTPGVFLASCPRKTPGCKEKSIRGKKKIAFDVNGRRIFILSNGSQKNFGKNQKFVGYATRTEYVPTKGMEAAGSDKANRHWVHDHEDEGGRWPKVFKDAAGNFIYAPGTLRINKWLRR